MHYSDHDEPFFPWMTFSLVLASICVFFVVNVLVTAGSETELFNRFAFTPADMGTVRPLYTLFTSMFVHVSFYHLASNMFYLYVAGSYVEARIRGLRFLFLYLAAGIGGSLVWAAFAQEGQMVLGASGAISGILGANLFIKNREETGVSIDRIRMEPGMLNGGGFTFWWIIGWIALQVFFGSLVPGEIAYAAHIGGVFVGLVMTAFLLNRSSGRA